MVRFDGSYPAVSLAVAAVRRDLVAFAREAGLDEREVGEVALAVSEAATNAIIHAYREEPGTIRVTAERDGDDLRVVVADDGPGLVPRTDSPGLGLGLPIIASLARRLEVVNEHGGTEIHMTFSAGEEDAA